MPLKDTFGEVKGFTERYLNKVKQVSCWTKLRQMLRDTKAMSNKSVEISITLLALYIVIELHDIASGCDPQDIADCVATYLDNGGDTEPDIVLSSCDGLRKICDESFAGLLGNPIGESELKVNASFFPYIHFCECLLADGDIKCSFAVSSFIFLFFGFVALYLMELTIEEDTDKTSINKNPRRFSFLFTLLYFSAAWIFYGSLINCSGEEYDDQKEIIQFIAAASIMVIFFLWVIEELFNEPDQHHAGMDAHYHHHEHHGPRENCLHQDIV